MLYFRLYFICLCLSTVLCSTWSDYPDCYINNERDRSFIGIVGTDDHTLYQGYAWDCHITHPRSSVEYSFEWFIGDKRINYCGWRKYHRYCTLYLRLETKVIGVPMCKVTMKYSNNSDDGPTGTCNATITNYLYGRQYVNMKKCVFAGHGRYKEIMEVGIAPSHDGESPPPSCYIFTTQNLAATSVKWLLDNKPYGTCDGNKLRNYGKYYKCDFTEDAVGKLTCLVEAELWHTNDSLNHYKAQCLSYPFEVPDKAPWIPITKIIKPSLHNGIYEDDFVENEECYVNNGYRGHVVLSDMDWSLDRGIVASCSVSYQLYNVEYFYQWVIGDKQMKYCDWQKGGKAFACRADFKPFPINEIGIPTCIVTMRLANGMTGSCNASMPILVVGKDNLNIKKCNFDGNKELELGIATRQDGQAQTCHIFTSLFITATRVKWLLDNKPHGTCDAYKFRFYGISERIRAESLPNYYKCDFTEDAVGNLTCAVEGDQWHTTPGGTQYIEQCNSHPFEVPTKTPLRTISIAATAPIDTNDCHVDIRDMNWDGQTFGADCTMLQPDAYKQTLTSKYNLNMKKCAFVGNNDEITVGIRPSHDGQPPSCHIFTSEHLTATSVQWFLDNKPYGTCDGDKLRNYGKYYKCDFTEDAVGNLTCAVEAELWHDTFGLYHYKAQCLSHPFDLPDKTPPGTTSTLATNTIGSDPSEGDSQSNKSPK